jgi:CubicO group peptidase (beta-lactamase class C family)
VLYAVDGSVRNDDLRGAKPACPVFVAPGGSCDLTNYQPGTNGALFSPQGGLRISMRGLAVIGRLLLNRGTHGQQRFLTPASIDAVLGAEWRFDGANGVSEGGFYCGYGLGSQALPSAVPGCRDRLFGGRAMVGHAGEAYGVRSGLWIDRQTGTGIAFFAANTPVDAEKGNSAYTATEEDLAARLPR